MHDLKFRSLFPVPDHRKFEKTAFNSAVCSAASLIYLSNVRLLTSIAMVPGYAFMNGENWGYAIIKARQQTGIANPDHPKVQEAASKIWDDLDVKGFDDSSKQHFYDSTENAAKMASLPGRPLSHGALHALLKSMIVQAWTAFEVLVESLWNGALDAGLTSVARPTKKEINRHQIGFGSRAKIRNAYQFVFKQDNTALMRILNDVSVDALAAMRNVLVHSAGIIDNDFMNHSESVAILAPFLSLGEGKTIELTGDVVRALVDPVSVNGYAFLQELDNWMKGHP